MAVSKAQKKSRLGGSQFHDSYIEIKTKNVLPHYSASFQSMPLASSDTCKATLLRIASISLVEITIFFSMINISSRVKNVRQHIR